MSFSNGMTFPRAFIINPRRPRSTIQSLKSTKVRSNKLQRRYSHTMPHALAALTRLSGLSIKRGTGESKPARGKEVTDEEVEVSGRVGEGGWWERWHFRVSLQRMPYDLCSSDTGNVERQASV